MGFNVVYQQFRAMYDSRDRMVDAVQTCISGW